MVSIGHNDFWIIFFNRDHHPLSMPYGIDLRTVDDDADV